MRRVCKAAARVAFVGPTEGVAGSVADTVVGTSAGADVGAGAGAAAGAGAGAAAGLMACVVTTTGAVCATGAMISVLVGSSLSVDVYEFVLP